MPYSLGPWLGGPMVTFTGGTSMSPHPLITTTSTAGSAATLTWPTYATASSGTWDWSDYSVWPAPRALAELTTEQRVEQEVQRARQIVSREQRRSARATATSRAAELLLSLLSPEQRASYERDRMFVVIGSAGGIYRIRPGSAGNVDWIDPPNSGREVAGVLCAHPQLYTPEGSLPDPDVALAQMLALTTDEAGFVATANVHRGRRPLVAAA